MKHSEPLFISSAEMDRHRKAAKELRSQYLRGIAGGTPSKDYVAQAERSFRGGLRRGYAPGDLRLLGDIHRIIGSDGSWLRLRDEPGTTDHQHVSSATNLRGGLPQTHRCARHIGLALKLVRKAEGRHA